MEEEIDIEEIKEKELGRGIKQARKLKHQETEKFEHNHITQKICEHYEIEPYELSKKTRKQKIVDARKAIILLSKEYNDISNKDLAEELNQAESTVSNILSDENNKKLIKIIKL